MKKIKQFIESEQGKDILTVIIVILVGMSSFGLGRLSKETDNKGLGISQAPAMETLAVEGSKNSLTQPSTKNSPVKGFFASKRGQKYYSTGCSAGKTIKQENRVYFATRDEAEKAGFELSSSCR